MELSTVSRMNCWGLRDLGFAHRPMLGRSSRGVFYERLERFGVPLIPKTCLDSVVYLYPTEKDAREGTNFGGSGFILLWEFHGTDQGLAYVVTNWHVACQGSPVVRINTVDGGCDVFDIDDVLWEFDPRYDIAVHPIRLKQGLHQYTCIPVEALMSEEIAASRRVGPGDDVFMIGRFIDHDGGNTNRPAARFGNISIDPTPIKQSNDAFARSYCVDMHSRSGYSGSPVFVYRTPGYDLEQQLGTQDKAKLLLAGTNLFLLLGIHFAQFPELWEVTEGGKLLREGVREPLLTEGKFIRGLSGMTCVLPAWNIMEVLNMPKVKAHRDHVERAVRQVFSSRTDIPASEVASPATDENPQHLEDFKSLLGAAARKSKQGE